MAFWNSLLNWLGYGPQEDQPEGFLRDRETEQQPPAGSRGKLYSLPSSRGNTQLIITSPRSYEQAVELADNIKNYRSVIVNLESVTAPEAQRIVDFISGATYALNGQTRRITSGIFLFTSSNINLRDDQEGYVSSANDWLADIGRKQQGG